MNVCIPSGMSNDFFFLQISFNQIQNSYSKIPKEMAEGGHSFPCFRDTICTAL